MILSLLRRTRITKYQRPNFNKKRLLTTGGNQNESTKTLAKVVRDRVTKFDQQMSYQGYYPLRWLVLFGTISLGSMLYFYRKEITEEVGLTGAEVTKRTLGDPGVQQQAQSLAQGVVYELLNDRKALRLTTDFLNELLARPQTREAALALLMDILSRPETQDSVVMLLQNMLADDTFSTKVGDFLYQVSEQEGTKLALAKLMKVVFEDIYIRSMANKFVAEVISSQTVQDAANTVAINATHSVLSDENIKDYSLTWARDVLNRPALHTQAGDAIWEALRYSVVPGFLGGKRAKDTVTITTTPAGTATTTIITEAAVEPEPPMKPHSNTEEIKIEESKIAPINIEPDRRNEESNESKPL